MHTAFLLHSFIVVVVPKVYKSRVTQSGDKDKPTKDEYQDLKQHLFY
jgi:hypothetical protein